MKWKRMTMMALAGSLLAGCAMTGGAGRYQSVDLFSDLAPATVARYEQEYQSLHQSGHCGGGMAELEYTNYWPTGLLLYWKRGSAMRMETSAGPVYMLQSTLGFGPLCLLYVGNTHAIFDAQGRRLSGMESHSISHMVMMHAGDSLLANGMKTEMMAMHLMHGLVSIHAMDGHVELSLITEPNPIAISGHLANHEGHAGHITSSLRPAAPVAAPPVAVPTVAPVAPLPAVPAPVAPSVVAPPPPAAPAAQNK